MQPLNWDPATDSCWVRVGKLPERHRNQRNLQLSTSSTKVNQLSECKDDQEYWFLLQLSQNQLCDSAGKIRTAAVAGIYRTSHFLFKHTWFWCCGDSERKLQAEPTQCAVVGEGVAPPSGTSSASWITIWMHLKTAHHESQSQIASQEW